MDKSILDGIIGGISGVVVAGLMVISISWAAFKVIVGAAQPGEVSVPQSPGVLY